MAGNIFFVIVEYYWVKLNYENNTVTRCLYQVWTCGENR